MRLENAVEYVPRTLPLLDVGDFESNGRGIRFRGATRSLGWQMVFVDLDGDGGGDILSYGGETDRQVIWSGFERAGEIDLAELDPDQLVRAGVTTVTGSHRLWRARRAGDVNSDGVVDLAFLRRGEGRVSVLFGHQRLDEIDAEEAILNGGGAHIVFPIFSAPNQRLVVAGEGDFDGDGFDDLVVSRVEVTGGRIHPLIVVPGRARWPFEVDLSEGFGFLAETAVEEFGIEVAFAGDVDGDGRDDLIVGAYRRDPSQSGGAYLLFGREIESGVIRPVTDLLDEGTAFRFEAAQAGERLGFRVAGIGDFNGDGFSDFAIGADRAGNDSHGASYVVFGDPSYRSASTPSLSLRELGDRTLRLVGEVGNARAAHVGAAGDFNVDGLADLIIGAPSGAGPFRDPRPGSSYVVFGSQRTGTLPLRELRGAGLRLTGAPNLGSPVAGGEDFTGDGVDDVLLTATPTAGTAVSSLFVIAGEPEDPRFRRGDAAGDGTLDISDAIFLLGHLFLGSEAPACADASDTDDNGRLEITDAVALLAFLFQGGTPPADPGGELCGVDPTVDVFVACRYDCRTR